MLLGCWDPPLIDCRENLGIHSKVSAENRRFILKVLQKHFVFGNLDDVPCHDFHPSDKSYEILLDLVKNGQQHDSN